jgi:hypothetical protein
VLHLANAPNKQRTTESFVRRFGSSTVSTSGRFLRRQIWIWPLIAAPFLAGLGWWVSRTIEDALRRQRIDELTTVLDADVAALRQWMDNQRATAELVAADETLSAAVQELLALSDQPREARSALVGAPAQATIRSRLAEPLRRGGFIGFLLTSPTGVVLAADEDAPVGMDLFDYNREFFSTVTRARAAVSKPFLSPLLLADQQGERRANLPCMYAAAPNSRLKRPPHRRSGASHPPR